MATSARRKQPKAPAPPIDLEEIEQDPGFRGMLSFLEVSPEDRAALLAQRSEVERHSPMGQKAADQPPAPRLEETPTGGTPMGQAPVTAEAPFPPPEQPMDQTAVEDSPGGDLSTDQQPVRRHAPDEPMGQSLMGGLLPPGAVPYIEVEGRGKRPLRFCQTVQDGHTAGEQLAYQTLWAYARKHGHAEPEGSCVVDVGLAQICWLLRSDHKNVKRLLGSLEEKLTIEVARKPDYRLAIPTRYRVFSYGQILQRRRDAGLEWVVRTRAVRFVDRATVERLWSEQAAGEQPMDHLPAGAGLPMGASPQRPMGEPATLAYELNQWTTIADADVRRLWEACRRGSPDCTEEEVLWFCGAKKALIRSGQIDNPAGLLIRSVPQVFAGGGGEALAEFRREQAAALERDRRRERLVAQLVLEDPHSTEAEVAWARELLEPGQGSV